jgi:membrane associated rhomboid family serine protease
MINNYFHLFFFVFFDVFPNFSKKYACKCVFCSVFITFANIFKNTTMSFSGSSFSSFWQYLPPAVKNILIINVLLFIAVFVFSRFDIDLSAFLGMRYWQADSFFITQLVTYMFMHGGLGHIFFNMFALVMFGSLLERTWGARRFLLYYMVTGIGAGIIQQIFWTVDFADFVLAIDNAVKSGSGQALLEQHSAVIHKLIKPEFYGELPDMLNSREMLPILKNAFFERNVTVGASGSIFGILLAFGWLFPLAELYMFFIPVPIKARLAVAIYAVAELFLGVANFAWDSIAHFAHLGGMLFGAVFILIWQKKRRY